MGLGIRNLYLARLAHSRASSVSTAITSWAGRRLPNWA